MKYTKYYLYTRAREDRKNIKEEWISKTITNPDFVKLQSDQRIRFYKYIIEVDKYLRVIVLEDGETVHNAFFDRSVKRRKGT